MRQAYLDFDELLDSVRDDKVLVALGGFPNQYLVARPHPPTVLVMDKGGGCGVLVVQIAQNDSRALYEQLAGSFILGDLLAGGVDELCSEAREKRARRAGEDVQFAGGCHDG